MNILSYILKVWLLTLLCAPLIAFAFSNPGKDYWDVYMIVLSSSLLLSIPLVLCMVIFLNFAPANWSKLKVKLINSMIAVGCIALTFLLMDKDFLNLNQSIFLWPLVYSLLMVFCIFIFKLNEKTVEN